MSDASRAAILQAIASALEGETPPLLPEPMDAFDDELGDDKVALARTFREELRRLGGDARFVASDADLPVAIASWAAERGFGPATAEIGSADYALLRAEALFADTGSAVVVERSAQRRLAPYLPRSCAIVADAGSLHPHLTRASMAAYFQPARDGATGEALIVTGPSRTADVEKTLVLGAHGPREVVVFIVGIAEG